jgi:hypothetical protein
MTQISYLVEELFLYILHPFIVIFFAILDGILDSLQLIHH